MIEKFESPAAWRGTALFKRPDWEYRLSVEELAEIERALRRIKRRGLSLTKITREDFELPRLEPVLASIQEGLENGSGAARIRRGLHRAGSRSRTSTAPATVPSTVSAPA